MNLSLNLDYKKSQQHPPRNNRTKGNSDVLVCGIGHGETRRSLTREAPCSHSRSVGKAVRVGKPFKNTCTLIFTLWDKDAKAYITQLAKIITEQALCKQNTEYHTKVKQNCH